MKNNKYSFLLVVLCLLLCNILVIGQEVKFEYSKSFYPTWDAIENDSITWGHLLVPENWDAKESNQIEIAVAIIKNTGNLDDAESTVFIQGGPGAGSIQNMDLWLYHPLRKTNDIVIMDIRGTGNSKPRLCPGLGKTLMKIIAKNQTAEEDEKEKTAAALACRKDLIVRGVDVSAYHSLSVAKDLHALKEYLNIKEWNVYGVSYGTYMAQVYASNFPKDIKTLVLDSSISDISNYYTLNTRNYINSLSKVFEKCKNDPECNVQYPDLETVFYKTIKDLNENPLTVATSKEDETFTYNAEDFKVAVQQALYHKQLVEVLPLLIYQFQDRNEEALSNLVSAFGSLLRMDYGLYYCVSCNEVLPNNDISELNREASKYPELQGAISFYKSDFKVCDKWNLELNDSLLLHHDLEGLHELDAPVMILAGEFDPITPASNGEEIADSFSNALVINAHTYGHVPGFTKIGNDLVETFVANPGQNVNLESFNNAPALSFAKSIKLNGGVSQMGKSFNNIDIFFVIPLAIALLLMLFFVGVHLFNLVKGNYEERSDKLVRGFGLLTSIVGVSVLIGFILAVIKVSGINYYILAFGLPDNYNYLYIGLFVFICLAAITTIGFFTQIKKLKERSVLFSLIFSHIVFAVYFLYWGII